MILATVTILLIVAASLTPRRMRKAKTQMPTVDSATARQRVALAERRGRARPTVDMISTQ